MVEVICLEKILGWQSFVAVRQPYITEAHN